MTKADGLISGKPTGPQEGREDIFKIVFEKIQTGIFIIDPTGHTIVDANPIAEFLIGLPKEQLIGKTCHEFVCPAKCGECPITDLHKDLHNIEKVLINVRGESVPILKTVAKASINEKEYLIESFVDIIDRKKSEDRRIALIAYMNEAVLRVQKPLEITTRNLQDIANQAKSGEYDYEDIRMQLQIQVNNLQLMAKTLAELSEKSAGEHDEIPEEFKQFFVGK
jgi:PAS domain S-box-containing protein